LVNAFPSATHQTAFQTGMTADRTLMIGWRIAAVSRSDLQDRLAGIKVLVTCPTSHV